MSHEKILASARQGNAAAIALLINQALINRGIQVSAVRKIDRLHVLLDGKEVPDRQFYTRVVYAATLCLGAPIQSVQIYGRQTGEKTPAWTQVFTLEPPFIQEKADEHPEPVQSTTPAPDTPSTILDTRSSLSNIPSPTPDTRHPTPDTPTPIPNTEHPTPATRHSALLLDPKLRLPLALSVCAALSLIAFHSFLTSAPKNSKEATAQTNANASSLDTAAFSAQVASPSSPPSPSPHPAENPNQPVLTINAVGDIIPGTNYPSDRLPEADGQFLFSAMKPFLGEGDITFGNFESTLTDYPYSAKDTSQGMTFAFRTPPAYAGLLKDAGFDVLSVANNHSMDFAEQGFEDTIAHIDQAGMKAVGRKGQIVYTEAKGIPIAFIGFSYLDVHNSMHDLTAASALVQEAQKQAKIVVISVHAGAEGSDEIYTRNQEEFFFGENRGNLIQFARTMVDQGADLVLGHGPHVPRSLELYRGKLIAYSLGNFMGYRTLSTEGTLGNSLILRAQLNAQGDFTGGRVIPVVLDADGVPKLDDYFQSVILIRNLIETDFPITPLLIDDMGYILKNEAPLS